MKTQDNDYRSVRARFFVDGECVYDKVITVAEYIAVKERFNKHYKNKIDRYYWFEPVAEKLKIRE